MWEDDLARAMEGAERRAAQRAEAIARAAAAREAAITALWRRIDAVIERINARVPKGGRRFHSEESEGPRTKVVFFGGRRLLFEVEALAYDTWRNEPVFYSDGLARVFVDPPARDLNALFCAITEQGPRWVVQPDRAPVTDETLGALLRVLVT